MSELPVAGMQPIFALRSQMQAAQFHIIARKFLAIVMMSLLVLLTSMNFFVYGQDKEATQYAASLENAPGESSETPDDPSGSPTGPDEKAPGNPVSFSEEYIHHQDEVPSLFIDNLIHQLLLQCSKVHPVHFELITPPPDARA
jgi:hypothetical protein